MEPQGGPGHNAVGRQDQVKAQVRAAYRGVALSHQTRSPAEVASRRVRAAMCVCGCGKPDRTKVPDSGVSLLAGARGQTARSDERRGQDENKQREQRQPIGAVDARSSDNRHEARALPALPSRWARPTPEGKISTGPRVISAPTCAGSRRRCSWQRGPRGCGSGGGSSSTWRVESSQLLRA